MQVASGETPPLPRCLESKAFSVWSVADVWTSRWDRGDDVHLSNERLEILPSYEGINILKTIIRIPIKHRIQWKVRRFFSWPIRFFKG